MVMLLFKYSLIRMRISLFHTTVYKCRNLHWYYTWNNCLHNYAKWAKLPRTVYFGTTNPYCHIACRKIITVNNNNISIQEFAKKLNVDTKVIIGLLEEFEYEIDNDIDTVIDLEMADLIADEYGFSVRKKDVDVVAQFTARPPIVTIMGHVDHGKTTLLDRLRNTTVALNEAGGITQSIGAFSVNVPGLDDTVTFVDTPGHAAFNSMRARGAQLTDIVVLVIAAEDGVMAQTKECLKHIRDSNVPFIVAINKIDRPNAKPEKIQEQLLTHGVQLEKYGGHTKSVLISALKGINIDNLLILLNNLAKELQCRAPRDGPVKAIVLEAEQSRQKGIVSSVLIKSGKLTVGKVLLAGNAMLKVRQILNANGKPIKSALPSDPVQVLGWRALPNPGDEALEMKNEAEARNLLKLMALEAKQGKVSPEPLLEKDHSAKSKKKTVKGKFKLPYRITLRQEAAAGLDTKPESRELNVIIKADVSGSLEALLGIISRFHSNDMKLNIINASVGQVTYSDLQLSDTSDAIVYSFNTDVGTDIVRKSAEMKVPVRSFDVIYKLLDDMKEEIENHLPPTVTETINGEGEILKIFKLTGGMKATAAGCRVTVGSFEKSDKNNVWKVKRDNKIVYEGEITSLKRGSGDISVAKQFTECGLILSKFSDYQEGDIIQCVKRESIKTKYEWKL